MRTDARRTALAWGVPVAWLLLLLAGSDWPPPIGFALLLPLLAVMGALIHWRWPAYTEWARATRPWRHLRAIAEGASVGLALGVLLLLLRLSFSPEPMPTGAAAGVWWAVCATVGGLNAWSVYGLAVWLTRSEGDETRN